MSANSIYRKWYFNLSAQYNIFEQCKKREVMLKCINKPYRTTRFLKFVNVQSIQYYQHDIIHDDVFNYYHTLATYKNGVPYDLKTINAFGKAARKEAQQVWRKTHTDHVVSFDYLIDIDAGGDQDIMWSFESAKMIKALFDTCEVPYSLRFSGMGFHFVIPNHVLVNGNIDDTIKEYGEICRYLHNEISEMVDLNVVDSMRVVKAAYSLSCYEDGIMRVCFPFNSDEEFYNFSIGMSDPDFWHGKLYKRGIHIFNVEGNTVLLLKKIRGKAYEKKKNS